MYVTANDWKRYFHDVVSMIEEQKDRLSDLDRSLGDGDHGVTMSIGWQAVRAELDGKLGEEQDCGKIATVVGKTFLSAVGSSVGPLYATGFMKGGKTIKGKTELGSEDLAAFWQAFVDGVKERGQAEVGDKTMVDTLGPAAQSLRTHYEDTADFFEAFSEAVSAGHKGMESTKGLISQKGRSSRLGERSVGFVDPGATSAYLMLSVFLHTLEKKQEVES